MAISGNRIISRVNIFSSAGVISGLVAHETGQRLLDLLNTAPPNMGGRESDFIRVTEAVIGGEPGQNPQQPVYVNKTNVLFVSEEKSEVPEKRPDTLYPYVSKEIIGIKFFVPSYTLTGKIHYLKGHHPQDVLTSRVRFFPLTDAYILSANGGEEAPASFIAVNKDQILYIESIF